jgi:hypothetical protein
LSAGRRFRDPHPTLLHVRSLTLFIGLAAACGCELNAPLETPPADDAGSRPAAPLDPMPVQPHMDAGSIQDASTGHDSGSTMAPPLPNFTLQCTGAPGAGVSGDPRSTWEKERAAHGALGHAASFSLQASEYRVQGIGHANVKAPFTLQTGNIGSGLVSFDGAVVEGVDEHGRVELYASSHQPAQMKATAGAIKELALKTIAVSGGMLDGAIDVSDERVGNTDFYRANAAVSALALEDVSQVYLYPEGTTGLDSRIEWMPSGPVVLREASSLTFYEADVGSVQKTMSAQLDLDYEAFGVTGDISSGSLDVKGVEVHGTPAAIFGLGAQLRAGASSIESRESFRLTQAINEAGLVLPAEVEIVPEVAEVWVAPSKAEVVRFYYRERSYGADAVLGEIQVGGEAKDLLELQTGFPKTLTGELIDAVADTGWAAPLVSIAAIPTVSIVFVIDVFNCIFGGCANQPPPLEPFPQWIEAGAIGTMEVRVKGNLARGTYGTTLTFVGRNYCPVSVPLTVQVGEPPASDADAGDL